MRKVYNINRKWYFCKGACHIPTEISAEWNIVNLPHSWNGIDGQDGENDYYRGRCIYAKRIDLSDYEKGEKYFIEIGAANSSADLYVNGKRVCHHDGGYSLWRADITDYLTGSDLIAIIVDNSKCDTVYPQMADFTFYGGIYRDVNLICVGNLHFDLENYGGCGLKITPGVAENNARVAVESRINGDLNGCRLRYTVRNAEDTAVATVESEERCVDLFIENVRLWNGRRDPYLYSLTVDILDGDNVLDSVCEYFGCRSFEVDAERGFILNGAEYPLRGVSRHQDRPNIGNALQKEDHEEDIRLILEMGANTVRLAHYQHDRYFYELCDRYGLVVWAEIPYISKHMENGIENTVSQMKELVTQCYNHPSVVMWGLSNEITMNGDTDPSLIENHRKLNDLCHTMDKTRYTVIAAVSPCPIDSPYLKIPDLVAYNHYFGWYGGDVSMNGPWFDRFHEAHPDIPIGCSEYGCEALNWHSSSPEQGDYTEEYQSYYHEELIKQFLSRKYLFATYVWNMFDFGADARMEGGENGLNHKGLVSFDRKYKKDAFYIYKAWLSDEPFVHITSKRYVMRVEDEVEVKVYSNLDEVELFANGKSVGRMRSKDKIFRFKVKNSGTVRLTAVAGECTDGAVICKTDKFCDSYRMREKGAVLNWFDITETDGFLSLNSKVADIMKVEEGRQLFSSVIGTFGNNVGGFEVTESMKDMMGGFTLLRLLGMMGMMGKSFTKDELLKINSKLNKIRNEKKE